MDQFLRIPADRLTRDNVVQFLHLDDAFEHASEELQAEVTAFNRDVAEVNAKHCECCKSIDDAKANLAKAPDAAQLRKAVGENADNKLTDAHHLARLWSKRVELVERYKAEVERVAETAHAESEAKKEEVLESLATLGFNAFGPSETEGINWPMFAQSRQPDARRLKEKADDLATVRQGLPQRLVSERKAAAHAERYCAAVADRYVGGKL